MLNAPKTQRRKVKAGSAHKTGGISREATVPVKPWTGGPKDITGLEPRQTLGPPVFGASGAMASGENAPDAEKPEPRQRSRHVIKEVASPTETAEPPETEKSERWFRSPWMEGPRKPCKPWSKTFGLRQSKLRAWPKI